MEINNVIEKLSIARPIFHSEADFQFALAWEIKTCYPDARIRLEYCPKEYPNMHMDILVILNGRWFPIELKYKTLQLDFDYLDEHFHTKGHGAQDLGRYDFLKDMERIEKIAQKSDLFHTGYAIMLSNDPTYWNPKRIMKQSVCDEFRIHDGATKHGKINWCGNPGAGTIKGRENAINLLGTYDLRWNKYSKPTDGRNGTFQYLVSGFSKPES